MKNLYVIAFFLLCTFQSTNAQVLWSDDFDSHPVGLLSTDPTGVNPGYGGWHVKIGSGQVQIVPETGRGYMMAMGWVDLVFGSTVDYVTLENIDVLWNTRNKNNNILKFEFETQTRNFGLPSSAELNHMVSLSFKNTQDFYQYNCYFDKVTAPYNNSWIKVEIFIDYNTNTFYQYIPGYSGKVDKKNSIGEPYKLTISGRYKFSLKKTIFFV